MNAAAPPLPPQTQLSPLSRQSRILIGLAFVPAVFVGTLICLRVIGLLRPFSVPTGAMTPAVSAGDHVMMERLTYLSRKPRRGDVIVFKTDGIAQLPPGQIYVKRVAGEPGDHLRISEGKLYINNEPVSVSNAAGEIAYFSPPAFVTPPPPTDVQVPVDRYFVLGDNSTNSYDSRYWGGVPGENILGRVSFCYWPRHRTGWVR